jgi:hypothetical protein
VKISNPRRTAWVHVLEHFECSTKGIALNSVGSKQKRTVTFLSGKKLFLKLMKVFSNSFNAESWYLKKLYAFMEIRPFTHSIHKSLSST